MKTQPMIMSDVLAAAKDHEAPDDSLKWMIRLLRDEGVDLLRADAATLTRGTPVYVDAAAEVLEVQRLMALNHIRFLPVMRGNELVGIVDLVELAQRDDLAAEAPVEQATTR